MKFQKIYNGFIKIDKGKNNYRTLLFFIIIIQTIILFIHMDKKETLSVDEVYSYSLANSTYGLLFPTKTLIPLTNYDIWEKWVTGNIFKEYLTASNKNEFNYTNVSDNLLQYSKPPLYYYLLHTVCSFFPNKFSKWFGLGLNLIFFIISQLLLFRVSQEIIKSEKYALLVCIFYGFSKACLDNFSLISFNSMLVCFNLLLLNFFIKNISKSKFSFSNFLELFLIILFGSYTNYLLLTYTFSLITVYYIISFKNNSYTNIKFITSSIFVSIIFLYLLSPEILDNLWLYFQTNDIKANLDIIIPRVGFVSHFLRKLFCIPYPYFMHTAFFLIIFFATYGCWILIYKFFNNKNQQKILITTIPIIILFLLVSFYANNEIINKDYTKYFFSFYPIVAIILLLIVKQFNKPYVLIIFILLSSFSSFYQLYLNSTTCNTDNKQLSIDKITNNNNAILVFNDYQDIQLLAPYLSLCDKIFLLPIQYNRIELYPPHLTKNDKVFMILNNKIIYTNKKYPQILSTKISSEEIDVYEITD